MYRKNDDKPSEVGTPNYTASIWKAIRRKNHIREQEENRGAPPRVTPRPENWMMLVLGILIWHHLNVVYLLFR